MTSSRALHPAPIRSPHRLPGSLGYLFPDSSEPWMSRASAMMIFASPVMGAYVLPVPMPFRTPLTDKQIVAAARKISRTLDPDVIAAIARVESRSGFDKVGRPTLRYEPHIFMARTRGAFGIDTDLSHPYSQRKKFASKNNAYDLLERALELDVIAALESCSWGKFQIMGFHARAMGYGSVKQFVMAMYHSEAQQLDAFVRFWTHLNKKHIPSLLKQEWRVIARIYNGPSYEPGGYHTKAEMAFNAEKGLREQFITEKTRRMAVSGLKEPVGKEQKNANYDDVFAVQALLKANRISRVGKIDGKCGTNTVAAIEQFQRLFMPQPTGVVEPGDTTWSRLIRQVKKK